MYLNINPVFRHEYRYKYDTHFYCLFIYSFSLRDWTMSPSALNIYIQTEMQTVALSYTSTIL